MKTFKRWIKEELGIDLSTEKVITGNWFSKHGIPMVVRCTCCQEELCVANSVINEERECFCYKCGEALDIIEDLEGEI